MVESEEKWLDEVFSKIPDGLQLVGRERAEYKKKLEVLVNEMAVTKSRITLDSFLSNPPPFCMDLFKLFHDRVLARNWRLAREKGQTVLFPFITKKRDKPDLDGPAKKVRRALKHSEYATNRVNMAEAFTRDVEEMKMTIVGWFNRGTLDKLLPTRDILGGIDVSTSLGKKIVRTARKAAETRPYAAVKQKDKLYLYAVGTKDGRPMVAPRRWNVDEFTLRDKDCPEHPKIQTDQ